jgi:hypothetical protein
MDSDIKEESVTLKLGGEELELRYGMAAFYYLTHKYGVGVREVFAPFMAKEPSLDAAFIERLADTVYAGLWKPDDEGNDTSGYSTFAVMQKLELGEMKNIMEVVKAAIEAAMPRAQGSGPTKPAKEPGKKAGTGATSTPPGEPSSP